MATIVIQVRLNPNGNGLLLNDGHSNGADITTNVRNGDTVKWKLIPNSGISSLDSIDDTSTDVFNPDPSKQPDGSLQGVVSASPGQLETYCIIYSIGGVSQSHDPKILVNP